MAENRRDAAKKWDYFHWLAYFVPMKELAALGSILGVVSKIRRRSVYRNTLEWGERASLATATRQWVRSWLLVKVEGSGGDVCMSIVEHNN